MNASGGTPLERAQRRLDRALTRFAAEAWDEGLLDLYYAIYFGGQVLLRTRGISPPSHTRMLEALEKDCVGPGLLEAAQIDELRRVVRVFQSTDEGSLKRKEAAVMHELLEIVRALVALAETMAQEDLNGT